MNPVRPPALQPGDIVAVLAPSSSILDHDQLDRGIEAMRSWGYEVIESTHLRSRHGHLSGPDADRLADLRRALQDPAVRAVFAGRGGYGAQRVVDAIDWEAFRDAPTLLVGFSDLTALLHAAWMRARTVSIHGPSVARYGSMPDASTERLRALLSGDEVPPIAFGANQVMTDGTATGRLVGGNLAMICANIGTEDQLVLDGDILLLEDVNEVPYAIDRMLTQLRRIGMLDGAAGIVVGGWVKCAAPMDRPSLTAGEVTAERLGDLGVPVVVDLPLGHTANQLAVAHGGEARLDTAEGTLLVGGAVEG